jgi:hypothetical protein
MTIAPQAANRVRCRAIAEADLPGLAALLARGFPASRLSYWTDGFARWRHVPQVDGVPRYGYVLDGGAAPVGVLLLISSQRGGQIISNLSSWYVEPAYRTHSTLLVSLATKLKHVTYLNASPAPHTWKTLQAQGFQPYNFGRSIVFALPGTGAVSTDIPDSLPEAQLLRDHRAMGQTVVTVERDGIVSPFVFKPRRLDRPPVPVLDVMFTRGPGDFRRCAPALARHFLPRGRLGFLIDGDQHGLSHYVEGKEPRYFKGPCRPILGDLAYTEKVIFG